MASAIRRENRLISRPREVKYEVIQWVTWAMSARISRQKEECMRWLGFAAGLLTLFVSFGGSARAQIETVQSKGGGPISSFFSSEELEVSRSGEWEIHCLHNRRVSSFLCIIALQSEIRPDEPFGQMLEQNLRRAHSARIRIQINDSYYGMRNSKRLTRIQLIEGSHIATSYTIRCESIEFQGKMTHGDRHLGRGPRFMETQQNRELFSAMRRTPACSVMFEGGGKTTNFEVPISGLFDAMGYANQWIQNRWPKPRRY